MSRIRGMNPVMFLKVPDYDMMVAVTRQFGDELFVDSLELIEKRLVALRDDQVNRVKMGLDDAISENMSRDTNVKSVLQGMHSPDGDLSQAIGFFYPRTRPEGVRKFLLDVACLRIGANLGSLIIGFNEQKSYIYEIFPAMKGQLKTINDLRTVMTDSQMQTVVRRFLETQPMKEVLSKAAINANYLMEVADDMIDGKIPIEKELVALQEIKAIARNGKNMGKAYLTTRREENVTYLKTDNRGIRIYYPDARSPFFVTIGEGGKDGYATAVLETTAEVFEEIVRAVGDVTTFDCGRNEIESHFEVPSFMLKVGTVRNSIVRNDEPLDRLRDICRSIGLRGYSAKEREELLGMIAEELSIKGQEGPHPTGAFIAVEDKTGKGIDGKAAPSVIGRVSGGGAYIGSRECMIDESKLNRTVTLFDMLDPYAADGSYANKGDQPEVIKALGEASFTL